jgi:hypothetical protein
MRSLAGPIASSRADAGLPRGRAAC